MNRAGLQAASRFTWIALFFILVLSNLSATYVHAQSANSIYKQAQAAEAREDYDAAFNLFQRALAKAPKDLRIRTGLYRVRVSDGAMHVTKGRQLLSAGDEQGALTEFLHAAEIDPGNEAAQQEIAKLRARQGQIQQARPLSPEEASAQSEIDSMGAPVELKPISNEPLTLHYAQDSKVVYQAIGEAAGINVLFDPDYTGKRIQVDLTNSSLLDALRIVGIMSGTFWRPITSNTIFVAQNNPTKRRELEEQAVQTFYLTNAWQQNDLNDVTTALRNVLGSTIKVFGVPGQNAIVARGTPDELLLAQKIISDLDKARPEVVVDIAVMEVSKNWERTIGLQWPSSVGVALQSPTASTTSTCPTGSTTCTPTTTTTGTTGTSPTLYNLAHLNSNDFAVTVGSATANLLLTDSNTRILQNPRLRATDSQKATMKVGERIPYATGSYQTGAATALVSSLVNTQFQYIDVGVNIEITPTVHIDRDVTLKIKIEVTALNGSSTISGVTEPIIAQKTSEQVVRLREGEVNILSGILNQQDQVSWSGIPGLSSIPILKYLFGSKDHTISDDEVVFLMVPHVVRSADVSPANLRVIDTGAGQNTIELRRIAADGPGANSAPQVQPVTAQTMRPVPLSTAGTVPGQSASAAAPAAIAQLKEAAGATGTQVPQTNLQVKQPTTATVGTPPTAPPGTQPAATPAAVQPGVPPAVPPPPAHLNMMMNSPGPVTAGSTFQVPIVVSGATDVASAALQIHYDPAKLDLVNVGTGDFLSRDGQNVALVHKDNDPDPGTLTVNASRPPGAAGVSGAGVVCVLSFQAKAAGDTSVAIIRAGAASKGQPPSPVQASQITVSVK